LAQSLVAASAFPSVNTTTKTPNTINLATEDPEDLATTLANLTMVDNLVMVNLAMALANLTMVDNLVTVNLVTVNLVMVNLASLAKLVFLDKLVMDKLVVTLTNPLALVDLLELIITLMGVIMVVIMVDIMVDLPMDRMGKVT